MTVRRCPIRSASAPIAGVATTLAQIAAAKDSGDLLRVETASGQPYRPERQLHADHQKRSGIERRQPDGGPAAVSLPQQSCHPPPSTLR